MPKSFVELAIEAARQEVDDAPGDRVATARRIHASIERHRRVRVRGIKMIAAITASLFGSTAFAWYAGWSLPWIAPRTPAEAPATIEPVRRAPRPQFRPPMTPAIAVPPEPARGEVPPAASTTPGATDAAIAVTPPVPVRTEASPASPRTSPVARAERSPAAPPTTPVEPPVVVPPGAGSTASPVGGASVRPGPAMPRIGAVAGKHNDDQDTASGSSSAELAAYRRAHDAHFRGADPAAALAAWDAYLASYPDGALALEARYDRALLLVKLERWAEADAALRPFAAAPAGSSRQDEAARLLAAITGRPR